MFAEKTPQESFSRFLTGTSFKNELHEKQTS